MTHLGYFYSMKTQLPRIWLAMMVITAVVIIIFMLKENTQRYGRIAKFNTTTNDVMEVNQSWILGGRGDHLPSPKHGAILTLFTTFKASYNKSFIHKNTIRNWELLSPDVIPVLFTDLNVPSSTVDYARERKWHIFSIPQRSKGGMPILRYMFLEAQKLFHTRFYGYANGDILFDRGLPDTIHGLMRLNKSLSEVLIVGQRRNWNIKWQQHVSDIKEIGEYAQSAPLFMACAQDYFISTRNGYPWSTIPDFVVGRVGYDNWLLIKALTKQIPLVDATITVTALHQTDTKGIYEGSTATVEKWLNVQLAGASENNSSNGLHLGYTYCAHFHTIRYHGSIIIREGRSNGKICNNHTVPHVLSPFHLSNDFGWNVKLVMS